MEKKPSYNVKQLPSIWALILVWLIFILMQTYIIASHDNILYALICSIYNSMFFIIIIYINLKYLLPYFLNEKSPIIYIGFLLGLALLISPIKTYCNQLYLDHFPISKRTWLLNSHFNFINLVVIGALSSLVKIPIAWFLIQKEKTELITKNIETELQFLKNQINPHFLFNTLNNLYALTLKKSELAPDVVLKLSEMLRYMLYECNEKEVALEKEMKYIENYIELEKIRISKDVNITVEINGDIHSAKIAPLIIIPFVENSFKHGLKQNLHDPYLQIQTYISSDKLYFSIVNSKASIAAGINYQVQPGGIGLVNVKKRLQLIYPNKHSLQITDHPDRFEIQLTIKTK